MCYPLNFCEHVKDHWHDVDAASSLLKDQHPGRATEKDIGADRLPFLFGTCEITSKIGEWENLKERKKMRGAERQGPRKSRCQRCNDSTGNK